MPKPEINTLYFILITLLFFFVFIVSFLPLTYAENPKLQEGSTLFYKVIRGSKYSTAYQTSDISDTVLKFNQTNLTFQRFYAAAGSSAILEITINYQDGVPISVDYLPALIYLPPECLAKSLQGNLNWTTQIAVTRPPWATVVNKTISTSGFTVKAGAYQSVNLTLTITGIEPGTLTSLYDLNSGMLIYQYWVTDYGEIITQELVGVHYTPLIQSPIPNLILSAATLTFPTATAIHQTWKILQNRKNKPQPKNATVKSGFPKKPFYITLAGALLSLVTVFLPWGQFADLPIYLPLSLPSTSAGVLPFTLTFNSLLTSLTAHTAAILAWISITTHLYTNKKIPPQLATIVSSLLAFTSATIFVQTGWTPSWGLPITLIGGILSMASIIAANIKIEIMAEKPRNTPKPLSN